MDSREALAEVLKDYKGTLILVSHDRWLLSQITQQTLDIRKAGPIIYPGSYTEYRNRAAKQPQRQQKPISPAPAIPKLLGSEKPEEPQYTPRELSKEIGRITKLVAEIEVQVAGDEKALRDLEAQLANLGPTADVFTLTREHQRLQEELEGSIAAWQEHSERLERLTALKG